MPSYLHIISIVSVLVASASLVAVNSVWLTKRSLSLHLRMAIGFVTVISWLAYNLYYLHPENFNWSVSLPLYLCDLTGAIAGYSLISNNRRCRALLYFWGLGLTTQSFIFPIGDQNPYHIHYWIFWVMHGLIFACALFDLFEGRFRPQMADLVTATKCSLLYGLVIFSINTIFGWNYGFLGISSHTTPEIITMFGPWPYRVPILLGVSILQQSLLLLPWRAFSQTNI